MGLSFEPRGLISKLHNSGRYEEFFIEKPNGFDDIITITNYDDGMIGVEFENLDIILSKAWVDHIIKQRSERGWD